MIVKVIKVKPLINGSGVSGYDTGVGPQFLVASGAISATTAVVP